METTMAENEKRSEFWTLVLSYGATSLQAEW